MKLRRFITPLLIGTALLLGCAGSAFAAAKTNSSKSSSNSSSSSSGSTTTVTTSGNSQSTSAGAQGYSSTAALQIGTIVQLVTGNAHAIQPATQANLPQMYGVVVDPHNLSLTISDPSIQNETYVATAGTYDTLVSVQNGPVAIGDYVTMSAVDGVAMKADTSQKTVFGRAAGSFNGKTDSLGNVTLKTTHGATGSTVAIGIIPVVIDIEHNPNIKSTKANLPPVLQRVGLAIADKPVGPLKIYLSIAITIASLVISVVVLYAGVRNSVLSIGRNPLSRGSIIRGLIEVILASFLIVIIGLFAVYLLLKL